MLGKLGGWTDEALGQGRPLSRSGNKRGKAGGGGLCLWAAARGLPGQRSPHPHPTPPPLLNAGHLLRAGTGSRANTLTGD